MTTATVAQPTGTQFAVLYVMVILVGFIAVVVLISHERRGDRQDKKITRLDYRLESLLEFLGVEVPEPVEDDSPAAMATESTQTEVSGEPDETPTDEFPAIPATEPSGIPVQVHGALIEARDLSGEFPHPVDSAERKAMTAADINERLKQFRFTGRGR